MVETNSVLWDIMHDKYNVTSKLHLPVVTLDDTEIVASFKSKDDSGISFDLHASIMYDSHTVTNCDVDRAKNIDVESVVDSVSNNTSFIKWLIKHAKTQ